MPDLSPSSRIPSWLAPAVVVMLGMQLTLTWLNGSLLHRQHEDLLALREDIQSLTDSLEQDYWSGDETQESMAPARVIRDHVQRLQPVALLQNSPAEEEQARKELQESADSGKKAVSQAREMQSKLSIEENIRKADEKAKMEDAESHWQRWLLIALGAGMAAVVIRAWLRRRG